MAPELDMKIQSIKQQWDRVLALLAAAIGVLSLVFGWVAVSGVSLVTQQIPFLISGAVVGLVAFGVTSTLWISADLRDEWAKTISAGPSPTSRASSNRLPGQREDLRHRRGRECALAPNQDCLLRHLRYVQGPR
jgi:hypothetical protein